MNYLLDTNIVLYYLRGKALRDKIEAEYQIFAPQNTAIISVVTWGEIMSIAKRNY